MLNSQKQNAMCEGECDSTQNGTDRGAQGAICTIRDYPVFCEGRCVCFSLFLSVTSYQHKEQKLKCHILFFFVCFLCNAVQSTWRLKWWENKLTDSRCQHLWLMQWCILLLEQTGHKWKKKTAFIPYLKTVVNIELWLGGWWRQHNDAGWIPMQQYLWHCR